MDIFNLLWFTEKKQWCKHTLKPVVWTPSISIGDGSVYALVSSSPFFIWYRLSPSGFGMNSRDETFWTWRQENETRRKRNFNLHIVRQVKEELFYYNNIDQFSCLSNSIKTGWLY